MSAVVGPVVDLRAAREDVTYDGYGQYRIDVCLIVGGYSMAEAIGAVERLLVPKPPTQGGAP